MCKRSVKKEKKKKLQSSDTEKKLCRSYGADLYFFYPNAYALGYKYIATLWLYNVSKLGLGNEGKKTGLGNEREHWGLETKIQRNFHKGKFLRLFIRESNIFYPDRNLQSVIQNKRYSRY